MAAQGPLSAEKQLLNLIEAGEAKKQPAGGPNPVQAQAAQHSRMGIISPGAWKGRFSFFKDKARAAGKGQRAHQDALKTANNFLSAGVAILSVYLISSISLSYLNVKNLSAMQLPVAPVSAAPALSKVTSLLKESAVYLEKVKERDIFKMGAKPVEEEVAPTGKIIDLCGVLRVVGISWSADPDAMVEDTKVNRTYFIKKGDSVGELTVKEIQKDRVVMILGDQQMEIR
jgi:hypothetical protein